MAAVRKTTKFNVDGKPENWKFKILLLKCFFMNNNVV